MLQTELFVSRFCQWARRGNLPSSSNRRLPAAIRKVVTRDLPAQNGSYRLVFRQLRNTEGLHCSLIGDDTWVAPTPDHMLLSSAVGPRWDIQFDDIRDEHVRNAISWFFHYAQQYIYRSRMVNALGAIAFVYNRPCDFFASTGSVVTMVKDSGWFRNPHDLMTQEAPLRRMRLSTVSNNAREKRLKVWFDRLNSLDPFIHRMVFHYIRALQLAGNDFFEEAVTSLDKVVDVAGQFARTRLKTSMDDPRKAIGATLQLSTEDARALKSLYDQRCFFGAHPSLSKWWDYAEIFPDDNLSGFFEAVKNLMWKVCRAEEQVRVVEKSPVDWALWFCEHALVLWDAVWFEHVPDSPYVFW